MSDEKFESAEVLKTWLLGKGVDSDLENRANASENLWQMMYWYPSTLEGITFEELTGCGIIPPVARHISNKLEKQQPNGEWRCCSRILVFVCLNLNLFKSYLASN